MELSTSAKQQILSSNILTKEELEEYETLSAIEEDDRTKEENLSLGLLCSKILGSDKAPTKTNILPWFPDEWIYQSGPSEIIGIPGGMPCPWCDADMKEKDHKYIAVCDRNDKHVVKWLPWGG